MISMDKQYRTRSGNEVRIYATDGADLSSLPHCVHGAVKDPAGWAICCWLQDGYQTVLEGPFDLIEVKPRIKRTVWLNVYPPNVYTCDGSNTKSGADSRADYNRIACVKVEIDVEEGEGL
jgi:hypothetical protein